MLWYSSLDHLDWARAPSRKTSPSLRTSRDTICLYSRPPTADLLAQGIHSTHGATTKFVRLYPSKREYASGKGFEADDEPMYKGDNSKATTEEALAFATIIAARSEFADKNANAGHLSLQAAVMAECDKPPKEGLKLEMRFLNPETQQYEGKPELMCKYLAQAKHDVRQEEFE